jgi:hypothetical protein
MAKILGCPDAHVYECPLRWEHLASTERAAVRVCAECQSRVYACETAEQVYRHARAGRCVVFAGRTTTAPIHAEDATPAHAEGEPLHTLDIETEPLHLDPHLTFMPVSLLEAPLPEDGEGNSQEAQGDGHVVEDPWITSVTVPCPRCESHPCACGDAFW